MSTSTANPRILDLFLQKPVYWFLSLMHPHSPKPPVHSPDPPEAVDFDAGTPNGNHHGYNGHHRWRRDRMSLLPLYDRGGPVSLTPSADAALGELAAIELQLRDQRRAEAENSSPA